jgi:TonB family protein
MAFSVGAHTLLLVVLIGGAAFESRPKTDNMQILSMIPAKIFDEQGVGGGNPMAPENPPPQPMMQQTPQPVTAPPQPQPTPVQQVQQVQPQQPVAQQKPPPEPQRRVEPKPVEREVPDTKADLPSPTPPKKHEIKVDYTPYNASSAKKTKMRPKTDDSQAQASAAAAQAAAADAKRRRAIQQALNNLQTGLEVKTSQQRSVVDTKGDGGEAYADYNSVIQSIYFHAWTTPDNVANKLAQAKVKLVLSRDGSILSADIIDSSGESAVDKSVERALRSVTHVPSFPSTSHDQQRTFYILFNLEAKEGSG